MLKCQELRTVGTEMPNRQVDNRSTDAETASTLQNSREVCPLTSHGQYLVCAICGHILSLGGIRTKPRKARFDHRRTFSNEVY